MQGTSASSTGAGVYGSANSLSGLNFGVYGRTGSASGYGIYAVNAGGGRAAYFDGDATTVGAHTFGSVTETVLDGGSLTASDALLVESARDLTIDSHDALFIESAREMTLTANDELLIGSARDMTLTTNDALLVASAGDLTIDSNNHASMTSGATLSLDSGSSLTMNAEGAFTSTASFHRFNGNAGLGISPVFQLQLSQNSAAKPTSNTWTIASDSRLKKDIQTIDGALDKLLRLRGVTYRWIEPAGQGGMEGEYMGLIAQEVAQVFPDWVGTDPHGFHNVTVSGFEGLVAEAVRQLHDEYSQRLAELEARCRLLEAQFATEGDSGAGLVNEEVGR